MPDVLITVKAVLDAAAMASGDRNYCGQAPQSPGVPYTVLSRVTDVPDNTLSSGVIHRNVRVQVEAYARTYIELSAAGGLEEQIRGAMEAAAFTNVELMTQGAPYDPAVKLHGVIIDFSVWTN